tara:strand:+ start:3058 stop:4110 length:1053 start_codon:yes stop_codon:yes gene_type:complete
MVEPITINGREISNTNRPYVIAEMSGNHNNSLRKALSIVRAASECGADAIKLQAYTPEQITIKSSNNDFIISDEESLWKDRSLYDLYQEAYTPREWFEEIILEAQKLNIDCFSSVFDELDVEFLEELNVPAYKIASFENNHLPLIRKVASTKKPVIISTGVSTEEEIKEAVENARESGCTQLALLKCNSSYPAKIDETNLMSIPVLREKFDCIVGLSDHSMGIGAAVGSVVLGSSIIEKHFIVSRGDKGVDSSFSSDVSEFSLLVSEVNNVWEALGTSELRITEGEKGSKMFKRSIYACDYVKKGDKFSVSNIKVIRPGFGLHPRHFDEILGKTSLRDLSPGDRIDKSCF